MVVFPHLIPKRCYRAELKTAFIGALAPKGAVGPKPVVIMLPFRQEIFQVGGLQVNGRIKLLKIRFLGTFDLAVKVRASGLVGAEFYAVFHKPPLNLFREKLHPAIGPDALHRKRQLFKHLVQKIKRVAGGAFFVDLEHSVARTVVYCRV